MGEKRVSPKGSVLVVGGGIAGVQAALDLADSGFLVHLVERSPAIGGAMSQLDKTFPTNDCSACILSPKLVECGRHLNIELITLGEVRSLEGEPGNFRAQVVQHPRYVDPERCIACGTCAEKCPKRVDDPFNFGLGQRKAIYLRYPQAVPLKYAIDPRHCIRLNKPGKCGFCEKVCPAGAIRFDDGPKVRELEVGSVILAPGFRPFDPSGLDFTGYGRLPDVVTSMEFERLLSPSGPTGGHLVRPSDGKEPRRIAWLQCVGSRDINRACHGYCSSVCCMYAMKQAIIAREHAGAGLETTIFFMDMRAHGKGFERYYLKAREEGISFQRARVHSVIPTGEGRLALRYGDAQGEVVEEPFDMVVLSVGLEMDPENVELLHRIGADTTADGFLSVTSLEPLSTTRPGVFVCGAASGPKDIPQSVMEASGAAAEAQALLAPSRWSETKAREFPPERNVYAEPPRIGVFVCHCGINIAGVVDVKEVAEYARTLPGVTFVQDNLFTCSQDTIQQMAATIKEQGLNRVVVASCTPRTHEPLFQETMREAGLNKCLFEMANIRDQDAWVHMNEPERATEKAKDLVRMAVAKVAGHRPLPANTVPVEQRALVVGGGMAGMTAALALADQGFPVTLVEREDRLGGNALNLAHTWRGEDARRLVAATISRVQDHPSIDVRLNTQVAEVTGSVGRFETLLSDSTRLRHGVALLATGALPYTPEKGEYLYGIHPSVRLLNEMDGLLQEGDPLEGVDQVAFIHCVGSRNSRHPYCSRVCCTHAIQQALALKQRRPDLAVFMLYRDIRTYGPHEALYLEARKAGIVFVHFEPEHPPQVELEGQGIRLEVEDHVLRRPLVLRPRLLILANGVVPREETGPLARFFKCALDPDGFLLEAHMKLRPVDFATEGVFLAGLCHYPKPLEESVAQAKAAAARAAIILSREEIPAESITAVVNPGKCTGCGVCQQVCPYHAIAVGADGKAQVDTGLCKGCGACVAGCRSDAVTLGNLGNQEIMAQIEAALWE